jgi:hypothetical protein
MPPLNVPTTSPSLRLAAGPRWTAAHACRGHSLQVVAWRLALTWRGHGGGIVAWIVPLAVVERAEARARWRPLPHCTLAVNALGLALAAWLIIRPDRGATPARLRLQPGGNDR